MRALAEVPAEAHGLVPVAVVAHNLQHKRSTAQQCHYVWGGLTKNYYCCSQAYMLQPKAYALQGALQLICCALSNAMSYASALLTATCGTCGEPLILHSTESGPNHTMLALFVFTCTSPPI
jgi:hypothetical protein